MTPDISYIVSAYNKPELLPCLLHSLNVQTHQDFEVIVADNSTDSDAAAEHRRIVGEFDKRFKYVLTRTKVPVPECYWAAEWVAKNMARGRFLCFPCDDCYYLPNFGRRMLGASYRNGWDFVMCHMLFAHYSEKHELFKSPITVKTGFILKAEAFPGFTGKPKRIEACGADRVMGSQLIESGVPWGILDECLVVHN